MQPGTPEGLRGQETKTITPETLIRSFEKNRIEPDERFATLYADYQEDMDRVARLQEMDQSKHQETALGFVGEALVYDLIQKGALGRSITARGTTKYDDFFHGADLVVEQFGTKRDPVISTIDVTLNQKDIKATQRAAMSGDRTESRPIGLDKKIERIRRHVDFLSRLSREQAVDLSGWIQSGGLQEKRTGANRQKFELAEKLMLLKYYVDPAWSDEVRPHFVDSGPQMVISLDTSFVNKALSTHGQTQEQQMKKIEYLLQTEVSFSLGALNEYLEDLSRKTQGNLFLDKYRAATQAWVRTFSSEQYELKMKKAIEECQKDPDLRGQVAYYMQTIGSALR